MPVSKQFERFSCCLQHLYSSYSRTLLVPFPVVRKCSACKKEQIFSTHPARRHPHGLPSPCHAGTDRRTEKRVGLTLDFDYILHQSPRKQKKNHKNCVLSQCLSLYRKTFFLHMAVILLQQQQTSRHPEPPPQNLLDLAQHSLLFQHSKMLLPPLVTDNPKLSSPSASSRTSTGHAWQPHVKFCNAFFP